MTGLYQEGLGERSVPLLLALPKGEGALVLWSFKVNPLEEGDIFLVQL